MNFNQSPPDPFIANDKQMKGPSPFKFNQNTFAAYSPGHPSISVDNPFAHSTASAIVSSSFIPNLPARQVESFTSRS
jgi:hypothetical protein